MSKKLSIGLFGFGVVGEGIYQVLSKTSTLHADVKKICIRNIEKKRAAPAHLFTTQYDDILDDAEINVVVELIDDASEAYQIVRKALAAGKAVVTANKKMLADHLTELLALQQWHGSSLLYEGAVGGSIPIIRNLEEYYDNDLLQHVSGIVNGSTNYILTQMFNEGVSFKEALQAAQQAGFAESDPSLDVKGIDAANKLVILLLHAYGILSKPAAHLCVGIENINDKDAVFAREKSYSIRLVAEAYRLQDGSVASFVIPRFIQKDHLLHGVEKENNAIVLQSSIADEQFLYGKGAGRYPTASAVLSDLSALRYGYRYEYRKFAGEKRRMANDFFLRLYVGFENWDSVSQADFEWIETFRCQENYNQIIGVIKASKLHTVNWFQQKGVSLIGLPDCIVENEEVARRKLKNHVLRLAGARENANTGDKLGMLFKPQWN